MMIVISILVLCGNVMGLEFTPRVADDLDSWCDVWLEIYDRGHLCFEGLAGRV